MQRARLKDIAEKVGCSIAVVSHVVNNSSGNITCRDELRDKILRSAAELDYTPHYASRALKSQRSFTIGVYIPPREGASIGYTYESTILGGIEKICREKSYDLLVISTGKGTHDAECASKLNARRVDGLILLHVEDDSDWAFPLVEKNVNVVAVNYYGDAELDTINFDDKAAAALAVSELHRLGHRRIAYIGPMHHNAGKGAQARLNGFNSKCAELGITTDPELIFDEQMPGSTPIDRGNASSENEVAVKIGSLIAALPTNQRPTAIMGYSDYYTMLVMRELQHAGLRFPDDVSAIGIDDSGICGILQPTLTSIHQPLSGMGEEAARYIINQSEKRLAKGNEDFGREPRWLQYAAPKFIKRESIGPCKA